MERQYRHSEDEQTREIPPWIGGPPRGTEGTPGSFCTQCGELLYGYHCCSCESRKKK